VNNILAKLTQHAPDLKLILPRGINPFAKNHKCSWCLTRELQKIQISVEMPPGFAGNHKKGTEE
jgi:hypothetical protein